MFSNHEKHGYGRIIYASTDHRVFYQGYWKYGERDGKGKMKYRNGAIEDG